MIKNRKENGDKKYEERILHLRRVSKKTSGGNYVSFSALVAIGDGKGNVGLGLGRGLEVPPAIQKAIAQAKKHMIFLPTFNETLPHQVILKYKASRLLLKPAPPGTGLKVGGVVRVILDIAGVNNASGKIIGTRNQITNAYAVMEAIKKLKPRITSEAKDGTKVEEPVQEEAKVEEVTKEVASVKKAEDSGESKVKKEVKVEKKAVKEVKKTEKKETKPVKKPVKKAAASIKKVKDSGEPKTKKS